MKNKLKYEECGIGKKLWVNFVKTCQNQKMQIVYHKSYTLTKMSYFFVGFSVELCKTLDQSCQKDNIARRRQPYVNSNNI